METGHKQDIAARAPNPAIPSGTRQNPAKSVTVELKTSPKSSVESSVKSSVKTAEEILRILARDSRTTIVEVAQTLGVTTRAIEKQISRIQKQGRLRRIGPDKGGHWEVIDKTEG